MEAKKTKFDNYFYVDRTKISNNEINGEILTNDEKTKSYIEVCLDACEDISYADLELYGVISYKQHILDVAKLEHEISELKNKVNRLTL